MAHDRPILGPGSIQAQDRSTSRPSSIHIGPARSIHIGHPAHRRLHTQRCCLRGSDRLNRIAAPAPMCSRNSHSPRHMHSCPVGHPRLLQTHRPRSKGRRCAYMNAYITYLHTQTYITHTFTDIHTYMHTSANQYTPALSHRAASNRARHASAKKCSDPMFGMNVGTNVQRSNVPIECFTRIFRCSAPIECPDRMSGSNELIESSNRITACQKRRMFGHTERNVGMSSTSYKRVQSGELADYEQMCGPAHAATGTRRVCSAPVCVRA